MEANYFTIMYWFCHTSVSLSNADLHYATWRPPLKRSLLAPRGPLKPLEVPLGPSRPITQICPNSHNLFLLPSQGCSGEKYPCHCKRHKSVGLIPRLGRSLGVENGNPLQYSCLENSMDREVCRIQPMGSQRVGQNWATEHSTLLPQRKCRK